MLGSITQWFADLFVAVFEAAWGLVTDLAIGIVDLLLTSVASAVGAIQLPEFMTTGLGSLFGSLDGSITYLLARSGLASAAAIIGAAWGFRLLRKFVTLFQW
jgi:hypothetical protein